MSGPYTASKGFALPRLIERLRIELRVEHGRELVESRLSRYGEAPLLLIADQLNANLLEQGWTEAPNAT